ncbi:hypothetical protein Dimus_017143 [Dionaea muscipula]
MKTVDADGMKTVDADVTDPPGNSVSDALVPDSGLAPSTLHRPHSGQRKEIGLTEVGNGAVAPSVFEGEGIPGPFCKMHFPVPEGNVTDLQ